MRIVLDTNVLVSGMLTPFGTCGKIVRMLTSDELTLCIDARIIFEYQDVLYRPKFDINTDMTDIIIEYIENTAEKHSSIPLSESLPDPDDDPFMEVAISARVDCLVTGNLKHFPGKCRHGILVFSPGEFLDYYKKNPKMNM
ncbi:MAG: putative toxin-antitoxin system toxin component, PIN family [Spirochaetia bacterium]|jgi:putative PIN family toxin of toxin-antitoxin system|nr:putative toxin-antitoxin system toxin component, PIN family [Spirochaetia bacterium]